VKNSLGDVADGVALLRRICPKARIAGRTGRKKYHRLLRRHPRVPPILQMKVEDLQPSDFQQPLLRQWIEQDILSQLPFRLVSFLKPSQELMYWGRPKLVRARLLRSCSLSSSY
jgi:hypothetical protein